LPFLDVQLYQDWLIQLQTWIADSHLLSAGVAGRRLKRIDERLQMLRAEA